VENQLVSSALYKVISGFKNVELLAPMKVNEIESSPTHVNVKTDNGANLTAQLVVGADGNESLVRKSNQIGALGWSYNQKGVVASVELEGVFGHENTAWQRFLDSGPLALLPVKKWNLLKIVFFE
jgi:2-octaprenylphenol hydroxylase